MEKYSKLIFLIVSLSLQVSDMCSISFTFSDIVDYAMSWNFVSTNTGEGRGGGGVTFLFFLPSELIL